MRVAVGTDVGVGVRVGVGVGMGVGVAASASGAGVDGRAAPLESGRSVGVSEPQAMIRMGITARKQAIRITRSLPLGGNGI